VTRVLPLVVSLWLMGAGVTIAQGNTTYHTESNVSLTGSVAYVDHVLAWNGTIISLTGAAPYAWTLLNASMPARWEASSSQPSDGTFHASSFDGPYLLHGVAQTQDYVVVDPITVAVPAGLSHIVFTPTTTTIETKAVEVGTTGGAAAPAPPRVAPGSGIGGVFMGALLFLLAAGFARRRRDGPIFVRKRR